MSFAQRTTKWARGLFPRWKGYNVRWKEVLGPSQDRMLLPWGFMGEEDVQGKVASRIRWLSEKQPKVIPQHEHMPRDLTTSEIANELSASLAEDMSHGAQQAYRRIVSYFLAVPGSGEQAGKYGDFTNSNYCTPDLSCFLEDIKRSYTEWGLKPCLHVESVRAKLRCLRVEEGLLSKNTYALFGTMGRYEALTHIWEGVIGPEGRLLQEMEGNVPRRLVAEVELSVEESFWFQSRPATAWPRVGNNPEQDLEQGLEGGKQGEMKKRTHYFTFESDYFGDEGQLEWVVSNINDVIASPSLSRALIQ